MEHPFNFPQNDYALTVLTHAATHTNGSNLTAIPSSTSILSSTSQAQNPSSDRTPVSTTTATPSSTLQFSSSSMITQRHINQQDARMSHSNSVLFLNGYRHQGPDHTNNTDMETLTYNPTQRSHSYMNGVYSNNDGRLGGVSTSQNHMSSSFSGTIGNLGILNAESYDDGRLAMSVRERPKRSAGQVMPFGVTEASGDSQEEGEKVGRRSSRKKRTATEQAGSKEIDEEEEARKKARGRPRVDTKDETAADRRRTQIRMAQRAYRHRKETTISSLEKQVQDLRGTNEEMSNIFIDLYDFAVGKGLLQREPEFGQQLQSTTERFLALAKATVHEDSHEEGHMDDGKQADLEPGRRGKASKSSPRKRQGTLEEQHTVDPVNPWGGYTMSKDDTPPSDDPTLSFVQNSYENRGRHSDLQVITRPTEDNASFPFNLMDLQQYRVEVPSLDEFSINFMPEMQPPLPKTHASSESSLARRLQRGAIERAFSLITSKTVSPDVFNRVFGLTLMYETRENLEARLRRAIVKTNKDALSQWRNPFVHIGGSGTYYPDSDPTNDDLRPKLRTGFSIGPFSPAATDARDLFAEDMRCCLPGYEGQFFDSNDVEGYLRGRGLDVPPSADFITAELDVSILSEAGSPKSNSSLDTSSPKTPESPRGQRWADPSFAPYTFDFTNPEPEDFPFPTLKYGNWENQRNETSANIDPIFNTLPDSTLVEDIRRQSPESVEGEVPFTKRFVTINVQTLINEILEKGVCLGRAPGFRPSDVNAAIVAAVKAGFE